MSSKHLISSAILKQCIYYVRKNPNKNILKLLSVVEKLDKTNVNKNKYNIVHKAFSDPEGSILKLIDNVFTQINHKCLEKIILNFVVNSGIISGEKRIISSKKYGCNIPWAILFDPTSACNINCKGCWAADYKKNTGLDFEVMDRIIREGKELGVYMYLFSGGEPLIKKKEIIRLCEIHSDCIFLSFTNGTLVDEAFAKELERVANFALAFSIEGFEKETDMRRGIGTYQKVLKAMDILRAYSLPFGFSTCYHSKNTDTVGSEQYINLMIEKGCLFGWYFTYMPVGCDAVPELLSDSEQREYMYHQVRYLRRTKPIFLLDFWNDGEFVGGCIAGGREYLHINANGDVEPCAFIHYSNVNINNTSLIDALRSPLFVQYGKNQPFNKNHLRPCPLLDNPRILRKMVYSSGAHSTELLHPENVDTLTEKCRGVAENWAVAADRLWKKTQENI